MLRIGQGNGRGINNPYSDEGGGIRNASGSEISEGVVTVKHLSRAMFWGASIVKAFET